MPPTGSTVRGLDAGGGTASDHGYVDREAQISRDLLAKKLEQQQVDANGRDRNQDGHGDQARHEEPEREADRHRQGVGHFENPRATSTEDCEPPIE